MVQTPTHLSEGGQDPNFPPKEYRKIVSSWQGDRYLLSTTVFAYHVLSLHVPLPGDSAPWPEPKEPSRASPERAEDSSPERSSQSDAPPLPRIFSLASSQPLTCVLKGHAAFRKSLAYVVDSWPALCQLARWGQKQAEQEMGERRACLGSSPPADPIQRDGLVIYDWVTLNWGII